MPTTPQPRADNPAYDALAMVIALTDPDPEPILGVPDEPDPNPGRDPRPRPSDGAQDVFQDPVPPDPAPVIGDDPASTGGTQ